MDKTSEDGNSYSSEDSASNKIVVVEMEEEDLSVQQVHAEANWAQEWDENWPNMENIQESALLYPRPQPGQAHRLGRAANTQVCINNRWVSLCLDTDAACSVVGRTVLNETIPDWEDRVLPVNGDAKFPGVGSRLTSLGLIGTDIIFPHQHGSV